MFGYGTLDELPELPKYKMDENRQIVIDVLIEENEKMYENEEDKSIDKENKDI